MICGGTTTLPRLLWIDLQDQGSACYRAGVAAERFYRSFHVRQRHTLPHSGFICKTRPPAWPPARRPRRRCRKHARARRATALASWQARAVRRRRVGDRELYLYIPTIIVILELARFIRSFIFRKARRAFRAQLRLQRLDGEPLQRGKGPRARRARGCGRAARRRARCRQPHHVSTRRQAGPTNLQLTSVLQGCGTRVRIELKRSILCKM